MGLSDLAAMGELGWGGGGGGGVKGEEGEVGGVKGLKLMESISVDDTKTSKTLKAFKPMKNWPLPANFSVLKQKWEVSARNCMNLVKRVYEQLLVTEDPKKKKTIEGIMQTDAKRDARATMGNGKRRVHFRLPRQVKTTVFQPMDRSSKVVQLWQMNMVLPIAWEIWAFPFRFALCNISTGQGLFIYEIDVGADVWFALDVLMSCAITIPSMTYPGQEYPAVTFKQILALYTRFEFVWVVLPILFYQAASAILMNGLFEGPQGWSTWLWCVSALPRLIQRMRRFINYFESIAVDPNVNVKHLQAVRIGLIILLSSHWVGCIFYLIARLQDFNNVTWLNDFETLLPNYQIRDSTIAMDYLICIYKGFNALSNLAYDLGVPMNMAEVFLSLAVMLVQVYISALILGTLLNYLVRRDPVEESHKQLVEQVVNFMDSKSIPSELYERVLLYYKFQHDKNRQYASSARVSLPKSLKIKVANANYRELVDRCSISGRFLYGCKEQLFNSLLVKLHMIHVMPGDHVVHKDEIPRELYFVQNGSVQVVDEHERVLSVVRSDVPDLPPIVGEVPFFLGINHLHAVKARLDGDLQLMVLSKNASTELFAEYPEQHAIICNNLMSTFDLTKEGRQIPGVEDDLSDKDKMATKKRIVESMNLRTEQRFSALRDAVRSGDADSVILLARQGANLDQQVRVHECE